MDISANKFIFTDEGRKLLVSQVGGIKFAIAGAVLVQGLDEISPELTYEKLASDGSVVLGMPGINYVSYSTGMVRVSSQSQESYNNALNDIYGKLFPVRYVPCREVSNDNGGTYGSYEIDFDRTAISWDMNNDISFDCLVLIGKQYAETNPAVFNVDNTQRPVVVGIAQSEGGIQFLKDANEYISFKLNLKFTLTDEDHDATEILSSDEDLMEMSKKLNIVNDGLKTDKDINIVDSKHPDSTLADLSLSDRGSFVSTKTLMVADPYGGSEIDNQFNAAGQVHIINKKDTSNGSPTYREQLIFTTLEEPDDYDYSNNELTGYYAGISLKGSGNTYIDASTSIQCSSVKYSGTESPAFRINAIDESDNYAVDVFGVENKILVPSGETTANGTKTIFSNNNICFTDDTVHKNYGNDILIASNKNYITSPNTKNTLLGSNENIITEGSHDNILIGSNDGKFINSTSENIIIGTDSCSVSAGYKNIVIGGNDNELDNVTGTMIFNGTGISTVNDDQYIFGKFNSDSSANIVVGNGTNTDSRINSLEFYSDAGELKLYDNAGNETICIGGTYGMQTSSIKVNEINSIDDSVSINGVLHCNDKLRVVGQNKQTYIEPGNITIRRKDALSQGAIDYIISADQTDLTIYRDTLPANIRANALYGNVYGNVTGELYGTLHGNVVKQDYPISTSSITTTSGITLTGTIDSTTVYVVSITDAAVLNDGKPLPIVIDISASDKTEIIIDYQYKCLDIPNSYASMVPAYVSNSISTSSELPAKYICMQAMDTVRHYRYNAGKWQCDY